MEFRNKRDEAFIMSIHELIITRLNDERFGVSELASLMNMSRATLHRRIKSASGHSVSQFIKNTRLNKALELLSNEPITVAEAAYMTGFGSATYFSKCFREYFGYPPVEIIKGTSDETVLENIIQEDIKEESRTLLHNFPIQTTSFIGREKEIGIIVDLIKKHRIVTLTGIGGCGKTRLACEIATQLVEEYLDGIWFVDLAPIETEELVTKQMMTAFGMSEMPDKDILNIIFEKIREDRLLIILDNCEHVLKTCVKVTQKLIESVPGLSLIITSRETLNIKGERIFTIPSLTLPDPSVSIDIANAEKSEAINLFTDRARLSNPAYKLIDENVFAVSKICRLLDGIPLAIELVASRARYMSCNTLLNRLSNKFDSMPSLDQGIAKRHRTMQATFEWSYNLLSKEEKILFRRLGVFAGEFDLIAVEEICGGENLPADKILDLLSKLVDKSMIQTVYQAGQEMRYRLLEMLQSYASNLLVDNGEFEKTRKKHFEYFTRMAEQAYREQFESSSLWLPRLMMEHDNLISALNWVERNSLEEFRLMAGYLAWYWVAASNLSSGKQYLEKALSLGPEETEAYARNLHGLAYITFYFKDIDTVFRLFDESRSLWQKFKNPFEEAYVLSLMSLSCNTLKEYKKGLKYSEESLKLARKLGNSGLIVNSLIYFCIAMVHSKQFKEALPYVEELKTSSEKLNHALGISGANHLRSDCALGLKEFVEAEKSYGLASQIASKYGITFNSYADLQGVAFALSGQGRWAKSLRINAAAVECFSSIGVEIYGIWPMWDEFIDTYIVGARKAVDEELVKQYEEEGVAMGFEKALEYALDFSRD